MRKLKRGDWLSKIIQDNGFTIGAEVGVYRGATAKRVLSSCPDIKIYYCVDLWEYRPDVYLDDREKRMRELEDQNFVYKLFEKNTGKYINKIKILKGVSWEKADEVEDESLDFVFVDADHAYEAVKKDIQAWYPKVKQGGLVAGHDINLPGVYKVVHEEFTNSSAVGIDNCWMSWKI